MYLFKLLLSPDTYLIKDCCCCLLVISNTLWPHRLQQARLPCPSPTPGAHSSSCPSNQWCHPTISSFVIAFSSSLQSCFKIGASASASILPMNIQVWFPLGLTGWISLQSTGLSRVFSNTTVQKCQFWCSVFFMVQLSHPYMTTGKTIALTRWTSLVA